MATPGLSKTQLWLGRLWALPNSIVGICYGSAAIPFGAKLVWDANTCILSYIDMPRWLMPTAMSLGHVHVFGMGRHHGSDQRAVLNRFGIPLLIEELLHTRQAEVLGPLYLPLHMLCMTLSVLVGGGTHDRNLLELGPERGLGPWPWSRCPD